MTWRYKTREVTGARDWLAHNPEVADPCILSSLPAKTRPEGFAPCGCHAAREHGSTCQLSALPHGAAARTTVCMFGSPKPSDRSSGLRSFGLSEADHSGSLSGSGPMQQRLVCVEAGQTFSIQRVKVLTPQVSSIHGRVTRGRSLVQYQPGPSQVAGKGIGRRRCVAVEMTAQLLGRVDRVQRYAIAYLTPRRVVVQRGSRPGVDVALGRRQTRLATVLSSTLAVREVLGLYALSVLRFGCRILVGCRPSHPIRRRSTLDKVELSCDAKRRAAVGAGRGVHGLEAEVRGLTRCAAEGG